MKKPSWLKNAVAKADGFYTKSGEKLKGRKLNEDFIAEWNGTKKVKPAPQPEAEVKEEASKPVAKKTTKKKTTKKTTSSKAAFSIFGKK